VAAITADIKVTDLDPERLRMVQELLKCMRSKTVAELYGFSPVLERRCAPEELLRDLYDHADAIYGATHDPTISTHSDAIMRGVKMLQELRVVARGADD
jgi:hypothetical protein